MFFLAISVLVKFGGYFPVLQSRSLPLSHVRSKQKYIAQGMLEKRMHLSKSYQTGKLTSGSCDLETESNDPTGKFTPWQENPFS